MLSTRTELRSFPGPVADQSTCVLADN